MYEKPQEASFPIFIGPGEPDWDEPWEDLLDNLPWSDDLRSGELWSVKGMAAFPVLVRLKHFSGRRGRGLMPRDRVQRIVSYEARRVAWTGAVRRALSR